MKALYSISQINAISNLGISQISPEYHAVVTPSAVFKTSPAPVRRSGLFLFSLDDYRHMRKSFASRIRRTSYTIDPSLATHTIRARLKGLLPEIHRQQALYTA